MLQNNRSDPPKPTGLLQPEIAGVEKHTERDDHAIIPLCESMKAPDLTDG